MTAANSYLHSETQNLSVNIRQCSKLSSRHTREVIDAICYLFYVLFRCCMNMNKKERKNSKEMSSSHLNSTLQRTHDPHPDQFNAGGNRDTQPTIFIKTFRKWTMNKIWRRRIVERPNGSSKRIHRPFKIAPHKHNKHGVIIYSAPIRKTNLFQLFFLLPRLRL